MFAWFKVLRSLSKQEQFLTENEKRFQRIEKLEAELDSITQKIKDCFEQIDDLDSKRKAFHSAIQADIASITDYEGKMDKAGKLATEKVEEIKDVAVSYANKINENLKQFEQQIAGFNKQVASLKQAVADSLR